MNAESIKNKISELYNEIKELRQKCFEIEVGDYNFIGKYIRFNDEYIYMYVYHMFLVENRVLLRGVSFEGFNCEYWDGSFFNWSTDAERKIDVDKLSEIEEITEEEYNKKFDETVQAFLKHKREFVDKDMKTWI